MAVGWPTYARVAGPASPPYPRAPTPATVVITPVPALTIRMRLFPLSAIYKLPALSTANPLHWFRNAEVAGPESPGFGPAPPPAEWVTIPVSAATLSTYAVVAT